MQTLGATGNHIKKPRARHLVGIRQTRRAYGWIMELLTGPSNGVYLHMPVPRPDSDPVRIGRVMCYRPKPRYK